ncbi:hypothetical protein JKP88DRAFT_272285 [Tribonema minus]|uniref:Uncharacterized protein n=1 Tax=Tribonema minus TaxID=303371 RepID=A0A836CNF7_9STRA|nr:hypothetical protein JKP88DRAFT_272285 [Tribonema minus]
MSSVDSIQQLLTELDKRVSESYWTSEDVTSVLEQLHKLALEDVLSPLLMVSLLLHSEAPPDLLEFLLRTVNADAPSTKKARLAALKTVTCVVKALGAGPHLERNAQRVKDAAWRVFAAETASNEVRAAALKPLRGVLKARPAALTEPSGAARNKPLRGVLKARPAAVTEPSGAARDPALSTTYLFGVKKNGSRQPLRGVLEARPAALTEASGAARNEPLRGALKARPAALTEPSGAARNKRLRGVLKARPAALTSGAAR